MFVLFDFLGAASRDAKPAQGLLQTALVELAGDRTCAVAVVSDSLGAVWALAPSVRTVHSIRSF